MQMTADIEAWESLIKVLNMQTSIYGEMRDLLKKKERLIVEGNTDELRDLIKHEEKMIERADALEEERLEVAALVGESFGAKGQPGIEDILKNAPRQSAEKLQEAALGMMKTLDEAATLNRSNAELIEQSMKFIEFNLNLLAHGTHLEDIYGEKGAIKDPKLPPKSLWNEKA